MYRDYDDLNEFNMHPDKVKVSIKEAGKLNIKEVVSLEDYKELWEYCEAMRSALTRWSCMRQKVSMISQYSLLQLQ